MFTAPRPPRALFDTQAEPKSSTASPAADADAGSSSAPSPGGFAGMDDLLSGLGMGGAGGADGDLSAMLAGLGAGGMPSDPKESLKMMQKMLSSPVITSYLESPEKIEQARQAVLSNAMMKVRVRGARERLGGVGARSKRRGGGWEERKTRQGVQGAKRRSAANTVPTQLVDSLVAVAFSSLTPF